jgi:hypothetical protein
MTAQDDRHKIIKANSSHRFRISQLYVATELLGASHNFTLAQKAVTVEVPQAKDTRYVKCYKWRAEVPLAYQIKQITLHIAVDDKLSVPHQALNAPFTYENFTEAETRDFDELIDSLSVLALDALRYWLAVLRWKSGIASIGEPMVTLSDDAAGGAILEETATRHRFWVQPHRRTGRMHREITRAEWQSAQASLSEEQKPPIWFEFLFEGSQRINNCDLTGAVLSLAIALESILRTLVVTQPRAGMALILDLMPKLKFWNQDWERAADLDRFKKLMSWRNRLMHSADIKDLNEQDLRRTYTTVKTFADFASEHLGHEKSA